MAKTTTKFSMISDINGDVTYTLLQSTVIYSAVMTPDVVQNITAPTEALRYAVRISWTHGSDIYVATDGNDAVIPTTPFALSNTEPNIEQVFVRAGGNVSIVTNTVGARCSVGFYAIG